MIAPKITKLESLVINISSKTNWSFIRVTTDDGLTGIGEASLNGWEPLQVAYAGMLSERLRGKRVDEVGRELMVVPHAAGGLVAHSVNSATDVALTDLAAKRAGVPLHRLFGGPARSRVRVYANINRRTRERSPDGFAKSARSAVEVGFNAIKVAPFDGVYWEDFSDREVRRRLALAIDRIFAIREAVGPDIEFLVDCHWRFDETTAIQVLRELQAARLFWFECPISEHPNHHDALARVRQAAAEFGTRLAGAETQVGVAAFRSIVERKLFDVVMPDIKYAGGFAEMLRIADLTAAGGISLAPHNPTGPVCNMASVHACALARNFLILEYQLAESPLFAEVVKRVEPQLVDGCFEVPTGPGLGVELDDDVIEAHPYQPLAPGSNLDPRLG